VSRGRAGDQFVCGVGRPALFHRQECLVGLPIRDIAANVGSTCRWWLLPLRGMVRF